MLFFHIQQYDVRKINHIFEVCKIAIMRVYNPEGSLLRRDQKELVNVLADFAKICEQHEIKWWLCSGTLLGAARHGGFIPWDDDVEDRKSVV